MKPIYSVKKTIELQVTGKCSACPMLLNLNTNYYCLGYQLIYREPVIIAITDDEAPNCPIKECEISIVNKPKIKHTI